MEKGNLAKWNKKVGDKIGPGDVLASVETDKATVDFEMQEDGYVAHLVVPEGAKDITLGSPVAIIVSKKEHIAAFANYKPEAAAAPAKATPAPVAQATPIQQAQPT